MKNWLIKISAPVCGTDEYYGAICDENPDGTEWLIDWFYEEGVMYLWDNYSYLMDYDEEELENDSDRLLQEFAEDCSMAVDELPEDESFEDYNADIIHDDSANS